MNKEIKYLIEDIVNFNPIDYSDEDIDIIDSETIHNMIRIKPKTKNELQSLIQKRINVSTGILDLSDIGTALITDMSQLFHIENIQYIKKIIFGENWDTSKVTDMNHMFYRCFELKELDISGWDTSNIRYMDNMFNGCSSLKQLDISNWDTSNVTDMGQMFYGCESLKKLNLSDWDTSNVRYMDNMFYGCSSLKELDISGWKVSNVTNMEKMFCECDKSIIPDWYEN